MSDFDVYQPGTWSLDGLVIASEFDAPTKQSHEQRASPWGIQIPGALIAASVFAASTLLFGSTTTAASTLEASPLAGVRSPAFVRPPKEAAPSPLRDINRGFNALFDAMRSGTRVVAPDDKLALAKKAVQHRNEQADINSWARRLVDDVKDADD